MASLKRDLSPAPSVSSVMTETNINLSSEEWSVREYVKKRLSKRLFLGHYQERRYVELLRVYRDMVILHWSEENLIQDIELVYVKLNRLYGSEKWIGITSPQMVGVPAAGYCLWVKLEDVPFGFYWFQVRRIRYHDNEVAVHLKVVRAVKDEIINVRAPCLNIKKTISDNVDAITSHLRSGIHALSKSQNNKTDDGPESGGSQEKNPQSHSPSSNKNPENESKAKASDCENSEPHTMRNKSETSTKTDSLNFSEVLQILVQNWKEIFKILCFGILGFLQGVGSFTFYVGEFSLKFMHEVSHFCETISPIMLAVIELFGKAIGGLYLLLAMIFKNATRQVVPPQNNVRPLKYRNYRAPRQRPSFGVYEAIGIGT